ncbi:alpha/beta hydrolase [Capilliphycus salinus ALCB114379]|uniref:alpha/beta hydrolase n=1 Tax=Capilliphycus salinus TaxID=2768948 RepID=UPI0039A48605
MNKRAKISRVSLVSLLSLGLVWGGGILPNLFKPKPVLGAEEITFSYPPVKVYMSVKNLETFVNEGKITGDFGVYAKLIGKTRVESLRQVLGRRFDVNPEIVSRAINMPLADPIFERLGQVLQVEANTNGSEALRTAIITAASDPGGFTLLNVIRKFPAESIQVDANLIFQLAEELPILLEYREAATQAIIKEAETEAAAEPKVDFSQLPDLRETGPYQLTKKEVSFQVRNIRQTETGLAGSYRLDVDFLIPEGLTEPVPLIISSHGFGSYKGHDSLARHIASYGFIVATPEHIGSSLNYREAFIRGEVDLLLSPIEYVSRPLDIIYLLDEVEKLVKTDPFWKKLIDFNNIGVIGNSFGGTTALALGGAEINYNRLQQQCTPENFSLNVSLLLQCRAVYLPPNNYDLRDPRIKAVVAAHPLTSALYGPEGMRKVEVPTLMVAGANDIVTPVIQEQIHPFLWLNSPNKYLSLLNPGTHFTSTLRSDTKGVAGVPKFIIGENFDLGRPYFFGLSTAFFNVYLKQRQQDLPYLSSSYNKSLSQEGLDINFIQSLSLEQLETAYGKSIPAPLLPKGPIVEVPQPPAGETILEEIQRTGVLKAAMRRDAVPFGYIDDKQNWTGYCSEFLNDFANHLTEKLNTPVKVQLVRFPSNIDNRFQIVRNKTVHLECGPNSIRNNIPGISFSKAFFITGTQFLIPAENEDKILPNTSLDNVKTGVVKNSTNELFIRQQYPQTDTVFFRGENAISEAVKAVTTNRIDTFANDGILTLGEIFRQKLPMENYTLVPEKPLTCDFYGLVLPNNDTQWQRMVNSFIDSQQAEQVWEGWFTFAFPYVLLNLDSCVNR